MKPVPLLAFIMLLIASQLNGQKTDQVKLKNGSVIRGEIVELIPEGHVTIDDFAGNTWVFPMNEIEEIRRVERIAAQQSIAFEPGWVNMTSIGFLAGSGNSMQVAPFTFQNSLGYRQSSGLYTGLIAGIEFLNINHVPLMADIQYTLRNSEVSPVAILRGGYMLPGKWSDDNYGNELSYSGGPAASVGVGLKIRSKESFAWDISVLYRYMQIRYSENYEWNDSEYSYTDIYNRLELRLGFYLD
jgi:hypothetical protein